MYNGGGMQTKGTGMLDVHGNVMIEGAAGDVVKTLTTGGADKAAADGNIVLRMNTPSTPATSTYGQLYINNISQGNITAFVSKEYRDEKHGNGNFYQQVAIPFYDKPIFSLSTELDKTFTINRWSQNEILKYNDAKVRSDHYTNTAVRTTDATGYYMLGSHQNNLDPNDPSGMTTIAPTPTGAVFTIHGRPFASGITRQLLGAGAGINFGTNGTRRNWYKETYNSYLQDKFESTANAWVGTYGRNIYQFGNPFLTNLDLKFIAFDENGASTGDDGNNLTALWGVMLDHGQVITRPDGSTYSTSSAVITYDTDV